MKRYVLDASALMALFEDRPGAEKVQELIARAAETQNFLLMSVVNWGEVYYSYWRDRGQDLYTLPEKGKAVTRQVTARPAYAEASAGSGYCRVRWLR